MNQISNEYWAGFFDGEGCVCISNLKRYKHVSLFVAITQKNPNVLYLLKSVFGGNVYSRKGRVVCHSWAATNVVVAKKFLEAIQPYCIAKAHDVKIGLQFLENVTPGNKGYKKLTDEERARRVALIPILRQGRESNLAQSKNLYEN
jgi:hypothetical protein